MKQIYYFIFVSLFLPLLLHAQADTVLPDWYASGGQYLNDQINNDASRGPNRVYILNRNGVYEVNGNISNSGWTLKMRASYGAGYLPFIKLVAQPSTPGLVPPQMILAGGKVYLTGIQVSGYNEDVPSTITTLNTFIVCNNTTSNDIVIDSCIFSNVVRGMVWMNIAGRYVKVTHSIFANVGYNGNNDIGNGRVVDLRTGSCDTLIVQNNTFVNIQDRLIRHYSSTAPIKYFLFDHNTVVNNMSFHGFLSFGLMNASGGSTGIITNNLLLDPFALGNDTDKTRQAEFVDNGENDAYGLARTVWVSAVPEPTATWTIKKNYYGISDSGQAFFNANLPSFSGIPLEGKPLPWHINAKIGIDSQTAFTKVPLKMTKIPQVMTNYMRWYRSPSGGNKTKTYLGLWTLANDYNRVDYVYLTDSLNCNFKCDVNLTSEGLDGKTIGDTRWAWLSTVGVNNPKGQLPATYDLSNNYPNPFNPATLMKYQVPMAGHITLKVYDLLGREVATLVDGIKQQGVYTAEFDGSRFASGVYFAKLSAYGENAQSYVKMIKMILTK
jgi:hypothetical protein